MIELGSLGKLWSESALFGLLCELMPTQNALLALGHFVDLAPPLNVFLVESVRTTLDISLTCLAIRRQ